MLRLRCRLCMALLRIIRSNRGISGMMVLAFLPCGSLAKHTAPLSQALQLAPFRSWAWVWLQLCTQGSVLQAVNGKVLAIACFSSCIAHASHHIAPRLRNSWASSKDACLLQICMPAAMLITLGMGSCCTWTGILHASFKVLYYLKLSTCIIFTFS